MWYTQQSMLQEFEDLAKKYVGDGQYPNILFLSVNKSIVAIYTNKPEAIDAYYKHLKINSKRNITLEDRLTGVIMMNSKNKQNQWISWESPLP